MRTALLVMVHGSPRPEANADMYLVIEQIKAREIFAMVQVGFLECNEPSITDAIEICVEQASERIVAVPYFLHTGTHVAQDLPDLLDAAKERHPNVEFAMGKYIGTSDRLTEILAERARACV
jgi:sirohydrochlorin ferrochelatase